MPTEPPDPGPGRLTQLLQRHRMGDDEAFDELVSIAYDQLRRVARAQLVRRGTPGTLSPTSLVHEVYVQLKDERGVDWQDRGHFFAISARAMRRILVDHARRRGAKKRGDGVPVFALTDFDPAVEHAADHSDRILAIDQAVTALGKVQDRLARLVECRYFAGLTEEETAEALGVSVRTVQRDWIRARAWLLKTLGDSSPPSPDPA
jgi:RNA polymerase sigma factor (TIGR02999 family)